MTLPRPLRLALLVAATIGLAGCVEPAPPQPNFPPLPFASEPPLLLNAAEVDVRGPAAPGNAEQAFPVTPRRAVEDWARTRLRATGHGGPAVVTIRNASAVERDLPMQGGMQSAFTNQLSQRYDASIDATVQIFDQRGVAVRTASVHAARSQTVLESTSLNQRQATLYALVSDLMSDFDRQMESQIRTNFGPYLASR